MEIAIAITIGITEMIKRVGLRDRWIPVAAIAIGLVSAYLTVSGVGIKELIVDGIIVGLSAMGLWSGTKTLTGR